MTAQPGAVGVRIGAPASTASSAKGETHDAGAPEFRFDTGEPPTHTRDVTTARPVARDPQSGRTRVDRDIASPDTGAAEPPRDASSSVEKKAVGASTHGARSPHRSRDDGERNSVADDTEDASPTDTNDASPRRDASRAQRADAALPDRMLALLARDPLPAVVTTTGVSATAAALERLAKTLGGSQTVDGTVSLPTPQTGGVAVVSSVSSQDSALPALSGLLLQAGPLADAASNALAASDASTTAGTTANAGNSATATPLPVTASPAALGPAVLDALRGAMPAAADGDTKAAIATLPDRGDSSRDTALGTSATADGASSPFAGLLARGVDATHAPARALAAAMPPSVPLAFDADFDDGLGARVTWMAEQRLGHAEIRVTPEGLGPIDIRLQMDGGRLHAQFNATHVDVRQALESGMDRLRDLLGRQGIELGQAQVGSGGADGRDRGSAPTGDAATPRLRGDEAREPVTHVRVRPSRGIVDTYA